MWNNAPHSDLATPNPMATPTLLLIAYCIAISGISLLGGMLPGWVRMTHTRMQLVMSLVSGLMLGVAFYHLLPHSIALEGTAHAADAAVWWLMIGLIGMLLLLRLFHFHQHDFSVEEHSHPDHQCDDHAHSHTRGHAHDHSQMNAAHQLSWFGLALGLALHTLIDGIALGAVMLTSHEGVGLIGIGVFLAIFLHKPLDAISIVTVMEAGGWSRSARTLANVSFALMCPLGALLFFFGVGDLSSGQNEVVAAALAFSAGAFICIALSDLLPEVHFHSHDRLKLSLAFLIGIAAAYAIGVVEPAGIHLTH
ncbi:MAG: ZIP family metal transporter [Halioglobus sp.]